MKMKMKMTSLLLLPLPDELIQEILSRLSLEAMFNCRLVCKRLLTMVSDPELAFLPSSTSLLYCFPSGCLALFDLRGGKAVSHRVCVPRGYFANSRNGFVCVISPAGIEVTVCNPIFGESMTLPRVISNYKEEEEEEVCGAAIGFVASEKRFKVLAVVCRGKPGTPLRGWWCQCVLAEYWTSLFTYVNGAVHWLDSGNLRFVIRAFDFESEQFHVLATPDDVLAVLAGSRKWKDAYGVQGSWTKIFREKIEAP